MVQHVFNQPDAIGYTTVTNFEQFTLSTLHRRDALKEDYARRLRTQIFNVAVESIFEPDRFRGLVPYTSTKLLQASYMERDVS